MNFTDSYFLSTAIICTAFQVIFIVMSLIQTGSVDNYIKLTFTFEKYSRWLSILAKAYLLFALMMWILYFIYG